MCTYSPFLWLLASIYKSKNKFLTSALLLVKPTLLFFQSVVGWAHWIRKNDLTTKISVQLGSRKYSPISCVQVTHFSFEINLPVYFQNFPQTFWWFANVYSVVFMWIPQQNVFQKSKRFFCNCRNNINLGYLQAFSVFKNNSLPFWFIWRSRHKPVQLWIFCRRVLVICDCVIRAVLKRTL